MQHSGGSPFGGPPPTELGPSFPGEPEAAAPISMRPPPPAGSRLDDMGQQAEEQGIPAGDGGGAPGKRWPRQETVVLLKIRSDMDAAFRDATLKGPLWEEVSRKLGELGYHRNPKKCKEKFENVHKYYKRTKEGRAGRQDGKSYRFFSQLEALHSSASYSAAAVAAGDTVPPMMAGGAATFFSVSGTPGTSTRPQSLPFSTAAASAATAPVAALLPPPMAAAPGLSFSSNTSSYTGTESDGEEVEEEGAGGRKRKLGDGEGDRGDAGREAWKTTPKMMMFFEGLMRQVMERQEEMQQRFLEAIERREQDRMIQEEAWRRQEMSCISREHELASQERAAAASRDAAIISFLQKLTGQTISFPPPPPPPPSPSIPAAATTPTKSPPPPPQSISTEIAAIAPEPPPPAQLQAVAQPGPAAAGPSGIMGAASSRWPKSEVHALIKLRSGMEEQYQESGPKGPLWEVISRGMRQLSYNRSAKRCKEKWENINKYYKKVKESNKKRPEDAKTCPYFHQLEALYRSKLHSSGHAALPPPPAEPKNSEAGGSNGFGFFEHGSSSAATTKKPEDIVKELMDQPLTDSLEDDTVAGDDEEDEENQEEEEGDKLFKIQFQRPRVGRSGGAGGPAGEGNFLAMVR